MEESPLHNDPEYREMIWYMENSGMVFHSVLEFFLNYKMSKKEPIEWYLKNENKTPPATF
jgi:hypothetical protein